MTIEQNIFLAKRNIVDYIYNSAKLEGCNVTFPETQTILDGVNVGTVTLDDIQTIQNLRDAWRFILSDIDADIDAEFNLEYICEVNGYVSRNESLAWGELRTGTVGISGTDYIPPIPIKEKVTEELDSIMKIPNAAERAIAYFLWNCHSQLFWDGNKRTSTICANRILISAGGGILTIKDNNRLEFNKRLVEFYNTGESSVINRWIFDNCIYGMT